MRQEETPAAANIQHITCKTRERPESYLSLFSRLFVSRSLRVQVCNLNLAVYVFPGVVTVQLGIAYPNYKVQVANLNPPV